MLNNENPVDFDKISQEWRIERSKTQMTLGKLISTIEKMPLDTQIINLINPHSYRGYYGDLAFVRGEGVRSAEELMKDCMNCLWKRFIGYKGGEFIMDPNTPIWIANYGEVGDKLIQITETQITLEWRKW